MTVDVKMTRMRWVLTIGLLAGGLVAAGISAAFGHYKFWDANKDLAQAYRDKAQVTEERESSRAQALLLGERLSEARENVARIKAELDAERLRNKTTREVPGVLAALAANAIKESQSDFEKAEKLIKEAESTSGPKAIASLRQALSGAKAQQEKASADESRRAAAKAAAAARNAREFKKYRAKVDAANLRFAGRAKTCDGLERLAGGPHTEASRFGTLVRSRAPRGVVHTEVEQAQGGMNECVILACLYDPFGRGSVTVRDKVTLRARCGIEKGQIIRY